MGVISTAPSILKDYLWYWFLKLDLAKIYDGSNVPQINNKNEAIKNIESNRKNVGSIYRKKEAASCPKGTTLITSGSKKGMCIDEGKVGLRLTT
jgi:ABC-type uncharacterized transport system substrate-binding protein